MSLSSGDELDLVGQLRPVAETITSRACSTFAAAARAGRPIARTAGFGAFANRILPRYHSLVGERVRVVLGSILERIDSGLLRRVMVFMPPRHGKSLTISQLGIAWYLARHPDRWCGLASYSASLALTLSRSARRFYATEQPLSRDAAAMAHWETLSGGGMWAAGVGGGITGKGASGLAIVDDPYKDYAEASSSVVRNAVLDWYDAVFATRLEKSAAQIMVMTRWREDDIAAKLLERAADNGESWHIVSLPAIAEPYMERASTALYPGCTIEPDPREPDEVLSPEQFAKESLDKTRERSQRFWSALYQQRPVPLQGSLIRREWLRTVPAVPAEAVRMLWWDKAATEGDGDYTAGVLIAHHEGIFYVERVWRGQWSAGARDSIIKATSRAEAARLAGKLLKVWGPQDPGAAGVADGQAFVRLLVGLPVATSIESGSKTLRAMPFASQAEGGNVRVLEADWTSDYIDELVSFPDGRHDDQVDATSGVFNKLAEHVAVPLKRATWGRTAEAAPYGGHATWGRR